MAVALIGLGPRVLALYAPGFEAGYPALVVLVLGQALNALAGSVGLLLVMTGHDGDVAKVSAGVAVLNITLNFALIPHFDMVGAAIASALSIVIWNFILVVVVRKRLKLNSSAIGWRL
jgi:O-antigen/teichoic acid export membrane protein